MCSFFCDSALTVTDFDVLYREWIGTEFNEPTGYLCVTDFSFHLWTPVAKQSLSHGWSIRSVASNIVQPLTYLLTRAVTIISYPYMTKQKQQTRGKLLNEGIFAAVILKLASNEALFSLNGSSVFVRLTEDGGYCWRSSWKNVRFLKCPHSSQRKGFFSKPNVLTLVLAS